MLRLRVSKSSSDLSARGRPDKGRDLGVHIDGCEACARLHVIEMDSSVIGAAASCYQALLPRAEGDGFYGGVVDPFVLLTAFRDEQGAVLARSNCCILTEEC